MAALAPATAFAEVERIEISHRSLIAEGQVFGDSGPYEKIRGKLFYAVDPENAANRPIVDLRRAPPGADGKVRFQGDFLLLKPVDLSVPGFFVAGTAHAPKNIAESITQAQAAAGRAMTVLAQDTINLGATVARGHVKLRPVNAVTPGQLQ